jgi:hypothetical protein
MRGCSFAGEFAQYLCQGVSLSGIAVLFMLLDLALAGCANLDFLDSDQIVPNQALVQPALEKIGEITPLRIYSHAETDAGLARGNRIKGGYLRQFLAILSRLASKLASRYSKPLRNGSDFFFEDAEFSTAFVVFRCWTPIRCALSWFWLAPKTAGHFIFYSVPTRRGRVTDACAPAPAR